MKYWAAIFLDVYMYIYIYVYIYIHKYIYIYICWIESPFAMAHFKNDVVSMSWNGGQLQAMNGLVFYRGQCGDFLNHGCTP